MTIRWVPFLAVAAIVVSIIAATVALILDSTGWASLSVAFGLAGIALAVLTGKEEESSGSSSSTRARGSRSTSTGPSR